MLREAFIPELYVKGSFNSPEEMFWVFFFLMDNKNHEANRVSFFTLPEVSGLHL